MKSKPIKVAKNLRVEFTLDDDGFTAEWDPALPTSLPRSLYRRYRLARDAFLAEVAAHRGEQVVVIDPDEAGKIEVAALGPDGITQKTTL